MKSLYIRATNGRKAYLEELLEDVYHTTNVNYENNESVKGVSTGKSIFRSCKFDTRKSMGHYCERFRELFEYSLLNDEFEFTPPGKKDTTLRTDSILRNIEIYLNKIGVDFSQYFGMEINREKWRWVLYEAMILHLLPAIFFVEYKDRYNDNHPYDDIHLQIQAAVMRIQTLIDREIFFICRDSNITKVYDTRFKNKKFNYKLPIEISSMVPPRIVKWENIAVNINCDYEEIYHNEEEEQPEKLLDGFIRVDEQKEEKIEISVNPDNNTAFTVSISSMSYEPKKNLTNDIEYYTYIDDSDEEKLKMLYKTNTQLKDDVKQKAQKDISDMFKTNENDYYCSIAKNIKGALDRISKIDMQLFIKKGIDISKYKDVLGLFSAEADEIVAFYIKKYGEEPCRLMVKNKLIELISIFSKQLEATSEQLTDKYKTLLDDSWRDEHKEAIDEYLSTAISLSPSVKKVHPELTTFERLKKAVKKYYDSL